MMTDRWRRVRVLFEAALEHDPVDVQAFVAREAADDDEVRAEVLSLLEHHLRAGEFLVEPAAARLPHLLAPDVEGEPLEPGAVVGAYTIVRELGRGGMGRVYLARDARLGRTVALKALAPHLGRDPLQRERLRREARAAAALTHPGICTVYALEEIDGELYISTEFVDGRTLGDEIRSGRPPSEEELLHAGREIAAALAAAHAAGIVHRDLKPDNVMRARDGRLKILDFGLARSSRQQTVGEPHFVTRPGVLIGTPGYIAPEQLAGETGDARADVYAFGVLMHEYASGVHPFLAGSPRTIPLIGGIIARCLRQIPEERFATGGEIAAALAAIDGGFAPYTTHTTWWRTHQLVIVALYLTSSIVSWKIKDLIETPLTIGIFVALGAAATIGGVFRGHLVFTERVNRSHLRTEIRRTAHATRLVDLLFAALLLVDGVILAGFRALWAVLTVSLAVGVALASLVLEPATTAAAFGEADGRD